MGLSTPFVLINKSCFEYNLKNSRILGQQLLNQTRSTTIKNVQIKIQLQHKRFRITYIYVIGKM